MNLFMKIIFLILVMLSISCKEVYDNPIQKIPAAILDTTFLNNTTAIL